MMFVILLISSALGKCSDHKDIDTCLADKPCSWEDENEEENGGFCFEVNCDTHPMKGLCYGASMCSWTDGQCALTDCIKYPASKCPTDKGCQKFTFTGLTERCYPSSWKLDAKDRCSERQEPLSCNRLRNCIWASDKCKTDGCSDKEPTTEACKESDGCKIVEIVEEHFESQECRPKNYDIDDPFCPKYETGTECDSTFDCMTDGKKCKSDPCLRKGETECKKDTKCTYGIPDILKDWKEAEDMCYSKDHVFVAGALDVVPALIQNKIFQLASALLLVLLV